MNTKARLFCIPYAGGSAAVFYMWKKYLHPDIELFPIELSGRGRRMRAPLYNNIGEAVDDIYETVKSYLDDAPYAIFGHSMGSCLAYELYHKISELNHQCAEHVFFSGRVSPCDDIEKENTYLLPDKDFIQQVFDLGGMSKEFLNNEILMNIFLPVLRADYKIIDTYEPIARMNRISCDISVLTGVRDRMTKSADIKRWGAYTDNECFFYEFDEGHFFINSYIDNVVNIINDRITDVLYKRHMIVT